MDGKRKALSKVWLAIEALFLVLCTYALGDTVVLAMRMGHAIGFRFILVTLAILVPGGFLVKGYLEYAKELTSGKRKLLTCAAVSAVFFGVSLVPRLNTFAFGVSEMPGLQTFNVRILNLAFGFGGSNYIFPIDFIVQAVLPIVLLALCEGREFKQRQTPRDLVSAILRVVGTIAAIWAGYAATVALARGGTFDHSWLIVGFIPIPGQIMLAFPLILAAAVIIVIWSRPWKS